MQLGKAKHLNGFGWALLVSSHEARRHHQFRAVGAYTLGEDPGQAAQGRGEGATWDMGATTGLC